MKPIDKILNWLVRVVVFVWLFTLMMGAQLLGFFLLEGRLKVQAPPVIGMLVLIGGYCLVAYLGAKAAKKWGKFAWRPLDRRQLGIILEGFVLMIAGKVALAWVNITLFHQQTTQNDKNIATVASFSQVMAVAIVIMTVALAPICEEVLFRGVLMGIFFKNKPAWAMGMASLLFGLAHSSTTIASFAIYVYMGLILARTYRKADNLQASILLHFINNAPAVMYLFMAH